MTGPVGYWQVGDIRERVAPLVAAGATEQHSVSEVSGSLIASVTDDDGNVIIGLIQMP